MEMKEEGEGGGGEAYELITELIIGPHAVKRARSRLAPDGGNWSAYDDGQVRARLETDFALASHVATRVEKDGTVVCRWFTPDGIVLVSKQIRPGVHFLLTVYPPRALVDRQRRRVSWARERRRLPPRGRHGRQLREGDYDEEPVDGDAEYS